MTVSKKRRRTIVVGEASYLWWVAPERDDSGNELRLISDDKQLHLVVSLGQRRPSSIVVCSLGDRFGARTGLRGPWRWFVAPLVLPAVLTPVAIRVLIEWATSADAAVVEVGYDGLPRRE